MSFDIETKKNIDIVFFLNKINQHNLKQHIMTIHENIKRIECIKQIAKVA